MKGWSGAIVSRADSAATKSDQRPSENRNVTPNRDLRAPHATALTFPENHEGELPILILGSDSGPMPSFRARKLCATLTIAIGLGMSMVACSDGGTSSQPTTQTTTNDHSHDHPEETTETQPTTQTTTNDHSHDHPEETSGTYLNDYEVSDPVFGTETMVTLSNGVRTITTNALPNHKTGVFPNSGNPNTISAQSATYKYTTDPVYTGIAQEVHIPGVAVNGVKFEPGTAESVSCATGETFRVEGLQNTFNLGMDFNNAHVQPTGAYHYHGLSDLLADTHNNAKSELIHVGFAADGHLIYISTKDDYTSSYRLSKTLRTGSNCQVSLGPGQGPEIAVGGTNPDGTYTSDWEYVEGYADLDECNGTVINGQYAYVITDEYPYISRCLKGEFTEIMQRDGTGPRDSQPGQPNLAVAAAQLGVTEGNLRAALGPPPPDHGAAALLLGVSIEDLLFALEASR